MRMRLLYITQDNEKSLSPFFSPLMSSLTFNYVWILGVVMLLAWPHKNLYEFILSHNPPLTFMIVFAAAMIMISYIQLRCGRGEIFVKDSYGKLLREGVKTHEEEYDFLTYALPQSLLHILLFVLLSLPLLILAGAISGVRVEDLLMALFILFMSALVCRWFAFLTYLLLGRWHLWGYLLPRVFFILIFFMTALFNDFANPILLLNLFFQGEVILVRDDLSRYPLFIMLTIGLALLLGLLIHLLIRHFRRKERLA